MSEANEVKRRRQDGLEAVMEFMDLEAEVDDDDGDGGANFLGCGSNSKQFAKRAFANNVFNGHLYTLYSVLKKIGWIYNLLLITASPTHFA